MTDGVGDPIDLTGYTCQAQIRKSYYSTTAHDFIITVPSPAAGEAIMSLSAANTANLAPGRYVYDVLIVSPSPFNEVTRIFEGIATVTPGVTRHV